MVQFKQFQHQLSAPLVIGGAFIAIFIVALIIFHLSASLVVSAAFLIVSSLAGYLFIQKFEENSGNEKTSDLALQSDLSRTEHKLNVIAKRMTALETRVTSIQTTPDPNVSPVSASIMEELETVSHALRDIADIIVEHHRILVEVDQIGTAEPELPLKSAQQTAGNDQKPWSEPEFEDDDGTIISMSKRQMETLLRQEMLNGRIGSYSENIVSLPSKKSAFNSLTFCIEAGHDDIIFESDLRRMGVSRNVLLLFDRIRFGYAFEVARNRAQNATPLLCPVSVITLLDSSAILEMIATLNRHPGLAQKMIFVLSEETLAGCGDIGRENIARLFKAGITFALEVSSDLMIDIVTLAGMGFRLILTPFRILKGAESGLIRTEIHPTDLPGLMDRYNMEIVATNLTGAQDVADLRKFNVYLAHGPLFGDPKRIQFTTHQEQNESDSGNILQRAADNKDNSEVVRRVIKRRENVRVTPFRDHLPKVGS